jgi:SAM-dependent methyltransferase
MSGFSAQWLSLREPHDRRARNPAVLDALARSFAGRDAVAVIDLGCGTGATLRVLTALLPRRQSWRLLDRDQALLAKARCQMSDVRDQTSDIRPPTPDLRHSASDLRPPTIAIATEAVDLAHGLEAALDWKADLVTMSALLDLVSAAWLDRLVGAVARRQVPLYAALNYDGRVALTPPSLHDDAVIAAVNSHQATDKGFGPALGPAAARAAPERLRGLGFAVIEGPSHWLFGPGDSAIQMAMLAGWAEAAGEIGVEAPVLADWLAERRAHVAAGRSIMWVGHMDFFASPMGRR